MLVETFGTAKVDEAKLVDAVQQVFDLRPGAIVRDLDLRRSLRAVWVGGSTPPAGPVRDLLAIASG